MPIKVTCKCGSSFAARDELAGRAVKCPNCGQPIQIPGPQGGKQPPAGQQRPPGQRPAQPRAQQPAAGRPQTPAGGGLGDLFDEAGLKAQAQVPKCPNCKEPIKQAGAVICVHCGYRFESGERHETRVVRDDGIEVRSSESFGNPDLDRAAVMLKKDAEEQTRLIKGTPAWVFFLVLVFLLSIGFVLTVASTAAFRGEEAEGPPPNTPAMIAGAFYFTAAMTIFVAGVLATIEGFKEKLIQGVLCLATCFIYSFIFVTMRWDQLKQIVKVYVVGQSVYLVGAMVFVEFVLLEKFSGALFLFLLTIIAGNALKTIGFSQIVTSAFKDEENVLHAILCWLTFGIYPIVYAAMNVNRLLTPLIMYVISWFLVEIAALVFWILVLTENITF
jgi:DNA-directed RNA polymerase subunit RPC12/RpoP